jgi:Rrf2 family nitric oxide-sensitive transcriptional repressor
VVSLTAEYALRAVIYLSAANGEPRTVHQVAEATHVPPDYLSKVLQELSKHGLVRSQRGLYGGFTLLRDPAELSVLEVVNAVSPLQRIKQCPLRGVNGRPEPEPELLCPLHQLLDDAVADMERKFSDASIGSLLQAAARENPFHMASPERKAPVRR